MTTNNKDASLLRHFGQIPDPRELAKISHPLVDIIVIAICAVICGADNWCDIQDFAKQKEKWLKSFLSLPNGVPSHDTFRRVFSILSPKAFRHHFADWIKSVKQVSHGEIVSIDGKTLRRSYDKGSNKAAIHMVSAWASANSVVLGQQKVNDKSNEITAIPELLKLLELKGCIVTIDAMGTQKDIARDIIDAKADYVLALKANQPRLYEKVESFFQQAVENGKPISQALDFYEQKDHGHGRDEHRRYYAYGGLDWLKEKKEWKGIKSIGMVEADRLADGKMTTQRRYYISSLEAKAKDIGLAIRGHWGIENSLHWVLDIAFREDECRKRAGYSGENFSVLRHIALSALRSEASKRSIKGKRLRAGWNKDYLEKVITGITESHA